MRAMVKNRKTKYLHWILFLCALFLLSHCVCVCVCPSLSRLLVHLSFVDFLLHIYLLLQYVYGSDAKMVEAHIFEKSMQIFAIAYLQTNAYIRFSSMVRANAAQIFRFSGT